MIVSQEMYMKIHELAWHINGLREHQRELGLPTIFVRYYGHIGMLNVEVVPNGWSMDHDDNESEFWMIYSNSYSECKEAIEYLEKLLEEKRECLNL